MIGSHFPLMLVAAYWPANLERRTLLMTMRKRTISSVLGLALLVPAWASATTLPSEAERAVVHACIDKASASLDVPSLVLRLLYSLESGRIGHISQWSESNYDIGPMQINSWWLPRLERGGFRLEELRDDACTNVFVGAWIFRGELQRSGDVAMAIARYHSPTPAHQRTYLDRAKKHLDRMLKAQQVAVADAVPPSDRAPSAMQGAARRPMLRSIAESDRLARSATVPGEGAAP